MNILRAMKSDRLTRAVTGLNKAKFDELTVEFGKIYHSRPPSETNWKGEKRERAVGGGADFKLKTDIEKVFFVLFYMKCYPTFDLLGLFFGLDKSNANRCLHAFLPIVEEVLGQKLMLPKRKISSMAEFTEFFGEIAQFIVDGTERPIQRPKNAEKQTDNYSGKKKRHTRKFLVGAENRKRILLLTPSEAGRRHDKTMADDLEIPDYVPGCVPIFGDLVFMGWQNVWENIHLPHKKPVKQELSKELKEENKKFSGKRVAIEHAIGGIKRYGCMTQVYRNRKPGFDDKLALVSAGLWNFYNKAA